MQVEPKRIKIYFHYIIKLENDMAVYITGAGEELGKWDVIQATRLGCHKDEIWLKEIELPNMINRFKYFISNKNSVDQKNIIWLDKKERIFTYDELKRFKNQELNRSIQIMSFNLRYENNIDGMHLWDNRKDIVLQTIMTNSADIIGLQEGRKKQIDYLAQSLPQYFTYIGHPRSDNLHDEQCGILFDSNKYVVRGSGTFWLSDTPEVPGSITFKNCLPRIVTWIKVYKFSNLVECIDRAYFVFNTHFDHISEISRIKSAEFLVKQIESISNSSEEKEKIIFISGDFNAEDDEETIITLKNNGFISTADEMCNKEKTFHEFSGKGEHKIDHIFYKMINCEISKPCTDYYVVKEKSSKGIYPSDHFPICANLKC